jgi:hypothetical protein
VDIQAGTAGRAAGAGKNRLVLLLRFGKAPVVLGVAAQVQGGLARPRAVGELLEMRLEHLGGGAVVVLVPLLNRLSKAEVNLFQSLDALLLCAHEQPGRCGCLGSVYALGDASLFKLRVVFARPEVGVRRANRSERAAHAARHAQLLLGRHAAQVQRPHGRVAVLAPGRLAGLDQAPRRLRAHGRRNDLASDDLASDDLVSASRTSGLQEQGAGQQPLRPQEHQ